MTRELFVDTNVLLGLTFYSDRWFQEAQPVYSDGFEIHVSELVVYEYCCSPDPFTNPPENPDNLDIDWSYEQGLVGRIRSQLSKPYREYRGEIRQLSDEELNIERAIQKFIDIFEIRKQAEPQIRSEFEKEFSNKAITRQYINEFVSTLIDQIIHASTVMKQKLARRVTVHSSKYDVATEDKRRWKEFPRNPPCEPDLSIIVDATQIIKNGSVNTVLTGDSDLLALQKIAKEYFGFDILSMTDEYAADRNRE